MSGAVESAAPAPQVPSAAERDRDLAGGNREDNALPNVSRYDLRFYSGLFGDAEGFPGSTIIEIPEGWESQASDLYILQSAAAFRDKGRISELYHEIAHNWNAKAKPTVQRCRYFDEAFASYFQGLAIREFEGGCP